VHEKNITLKLITELSLPIFRVGLGAYLLFTHYGILDMDEFMVTAFPIFQKVLLFLSHI
jgi:hypothetical protein